MSFDALAPHYRWMEFVLAGNKLQRCRTAFLERVAEPRQILLAGEGNGRFLIECRRRCPTAHVTVMDASGAMLQAARKRLALASGPNHSGVEFLQADVLTWNPPEHRYELVVTNFFLDCFPAGQLERVVAVLARSATAAARWLLADFQVPACGFSRYRAKAIHALMYAFFRVATRLPARALVCPDAFLRRHGFVLQDRRTQEWALLHTDLWSRGSVQR